MNINEKTKISKKINLKEWINIKIVWKKINNNEINIFSIKPLIWDNKKN